MAEQQLLDAFPGQAERLSGPLNARTFDAGQISTIGIEALEIGRTPYRLYFVLNPADGLRSVQLTPASRADATEQEFHLVENALVAKYGKPWITHSSDPEVVSSQWTFPTTTVTLRYVDFAKIGLRTLWLTYEKRTPNSGVDNL